MNNYLVITGGSKGIGKSTAAHFLKKEWSVINISRHDCPLPTVVNFNIDLSIPQWHQEYADTLQQAIPDSTAKICLVHNAALCLNDSIYNFSNEQFRTVMELGIVAPMLLNKVFLPKMAAGSSIIYIGSTLSEKAVANSCSYTISKHAIVGAMRSTCQDLNRPDIHTCCICPGFTETEMLIAHCGDQEEIINTLKNLVAAKRLIQPEEIANLIYFCASNAVINGSVIHAHLGQLEK